MLKILGEFSLILKCKICQGMWFIKEDRPHHFIRQHYNVFNLLVILKLKIHKTPEEYPNVQ